MADVPGITRRQALKRGAAAGGLLWATPWMKSIALAQTTAEPVSGTLSINMSGRLGTLPPGTPDNSGQDAFTFNVLQPNTTLQIVVAVDANLFPEIGLFAPGVPTTGTNLLTGTTFGLSSAGQGSGIATSIALPSAGVYTLAIEDQWAEGAETAGDYSITVTADKPLGPPTQVSNEAPETMLYDETD